MKRWQTDVITSGGGGFETKSGNEVLKGTPLGGTTGR